MRSTTEKIDRCNRMFGFKGIHGAPVEEQPYFVALYTDYKTQGHLEKPRVLAYPDGGKLLETFGDKTLVEIYRDDCFAGGFFDGDRPLEVLCRRLVDQEFLAVNITRFATEAAMRDAMMTANSVVHRLLNHWGYQADHLWRTGQLKV